MAARPSSHHDPVSASVLSSAQRRQRPRCHSAASHSGTLKAAHHAVQPCGWATENRPGVAATAALAGHSSADSSAIAHSLTRPVGRVAAAAPNTLIGSSAAAYGTASRLAGTLHHASWPRRTMVTGAVAAKAPSAARTAVLHCASPDGAARPAHSSPATPAIDSCRPTSSTASGSANQIVVAARASNSVAGTWRPATSATTAALTIHAERTVLGAAPVRAV